MRRGHCGHCGAFVPLGQRFCCPMCEARARLKREQLTGPNVLELDELRRIRVRGHSALGHVSDPVPVERRQLPGLQVRPRPLAERPYPPYFEKPTMYLPASSPIADVPELGWSAINSDDVDWELDVEELYQLTLLLVEWEQALRRRL